MVMSRFLPPFAALKAFDALGKQSGIRKAAEALGISHAIVSRHLRSLEQDLGLTLYDRQLGQLTSAGAAYHLRISAAITELESATVAARSKRSDSLVVWCAPGLAHQWLTVRLARYSLQKRGSILDLRASDAAPDLSNNQADGDIRYLSDNNTVSDRRIQRVELARPNVVPVASPAWIERRNCPIKTPQDILSADLIHEGDDDQWRRWFACQGIVPDIIPRIAHYGHAQLALTAAKAGQGIALGNSYLCQEDIADGRLVIVEPSVTPLHHAPLGAYVFSALATMWEDAAVARFRRWLVAEFK